MPMRGLRVVELGCGLGLPSLAAAAVGADVLATDWAPDAVSLLRDNAARNAIRLRVELIRWQEPQRILREAPWDVVLAADVLYERRNADQLLELLPRLGSEVLLADPSRPHAERFLEAAARDWVIETTHGARPRVAIHRLTLPAQGPT
jgi:predicted nicotinamide N-methyase